MSHVWWLSLVGPLSQGCFPTGDGPVDWLWFAETISEVHRDLGEAFMDTLVRGPTLIVFFGKVGLLQGKRFLGKGRQDLWRGRGCRLGDRRILVSLSHRRGGLGLGAGAGFARAFGFPMPLLPAQAAVAFGDAGQELLLGPLGFAFATALATLASLETLLRAADRPEAP